MIRHHGRCCICATCPELDCGVKSIDDYTIQELLDELITRDGVETYLSPWGATSIEATILVIKK